MFKIPQVEKSSYYIDKAMKSMQEVALKEREKIKERYSKNLGMRRKEKEEINLNKRKDLELFKIKYLNEQINRDVRKIVKRFPNFLKVSEIYIKLINTSQTPVSNIKDSLSLIKWIGDASDEFTEKTQFKIKKAKTSETIGFLMKKHLGKINSLFRKNKDAFEILENARKFMNKLPVFEDLYTIAIAGYPNVGKSTLMKKMTYSNVEIGNYPFTTKNLMFSYLKYNSKKVIQVIDTPGLLNRNKNNSIEERANIIIRDYAQSIVFVLDITDSVEKQIKLLKHAYEYKKPILIYLSKTDIYNEEHKEELQEIKTKIKKFKIFDNPDELKEFIINDFLKTKKDFNPDKLKVIR